MKVRGLKQGGNTKRRTHSQSYLSNPIWTQSDKPEALVLDWLKGEVERRRETSGHIPELVVEGSYCYGFPVVQSGARDFLRVVDGLFSCGGGTIEGEIQRDENTNMCQIGLKIASK
eukprot:1380169-Amorphochlora_amoeboformis.AAC.1